MSLKIEFVERASRPGARIAALCRQFGISRETGYKWLRRFQRDGYSGLEEKSRRPHGSPLATAEEIVLAVLEARQAHPSWGPKKLSVVLRRKLASQAPSQSTIARILQRFGQIRQKRKRSYSPVMLPPPKTLAKEPNEIWTVDFKGWWKARDGQRCEPLTIRDAFSRFVLAIRVMESPRLTSVRAVFEMLFRKYGLPQAIQCDNGNPFINVSSRGGLTRLSAWWISLGIRVIRSRPGCPQDNGAHERMHRDMRQELQLVPQATLTAEQRACDRWRQQYNHVRPHEALKGKVPADLYKPSKRRNLTPAVFFYPEGWSVRRTCSRGMFNFGGTTYQSSRALEYQTIALEPIGGLRYRLWFRDHDLGEIELCAPEATVDEVARRFLRRPCRKKAA